MGPAVTTPVGPLAARPPPRRQRPPPSALSPRAARGGAESRSPASCRPSVPGLRGGTCPPAGAEQTAAVGTGGERGGLPCGACGVPWGRPRGDTPQAPAHPALSGVSAGRGVRGAPGKGRSEGAAGRAAAARPHLDVEVGGVEAAGRDQPRLGRPQVLLHQFPGSLHQELAVALGRHGPRRVGPPGRGAEPSGSPPPPPPPRRPLRMRGAPGRPRGGSGGGSGADPGGAPGFAGSRLQAALSHRPAPSCSAELGFARLLRATPKTRRSGFLSPAGFPGTSVGSGSMRGSRPSLGNRALGSRRLGARRLAEGEG